MVQMPAAFVWSERQTCAAHGASEACERSLDLGRRRPYTARVGIWDGLKRAFAGDEGAAEKAVTSTAPSEAAFAMKIVDVFLIAGRGTIVTGKISAGSVRAGATLVLRRASGESRRCRVSGIEKSRQPLDAASAGENVGLLLDGLNKSDVASGDDLAGE